MTTLGTHNLLDGKAKPTNFAKILFFTESLPFDYGLSRSHDIFECREQRDLHIAVEKGHGWHLEGHYKPAHWGARKVTPNRGTYYLVDHEAKVLLLVEHRINAAFPPFKRGEKLFRKLAWWLHTRNTLKIIRKYKRKGYTIHAGGDPNTPRGVKAYKGLLNEVGIHYDRIGSTEKIKKITYLSKIGSDHLRVKAWV